MTPESLGARVIEARHTGRWRPACQELHKMLDDPTYASVGGHSQASLQGNPHSNDDTHFTDHDRNLLLYSMLEIKMSIDHDSLNALEYSTFDMFDTICGQGVAGYRVPTTPDLYETYEYKAGYDIDTFAPIVMYGSLETVRSAHLTTAKQCEPDFALEDVALQAYCNGFVSGDEEKFHLRRDAAQRRGEVGA